MTDSPIALITGGARGLGYACAEAIQENGARIVVADIDEQGVMEGRPLMTKRIPPAPRPSRSPRLRDGSDR